MSSRSVAAASPSAVVSFSSSWAMRHARVHHDRAGRPRRRHARRIHPRRARDPDRDANRDRLAEPGGHGAHAVVEIEHVAGAGQRARQGRCQLVVADTAREHDVEAIERCAFQRLEEVGRVRTGGDDAVGDEHDAAMDATSRRGERREQLTEVGGAGRAALEEREIVRVAVVGRASVEDRLRVLIERDDLQLDGIAVAIAQRVDEVANRLHVATEPEGARCAGVDRDEQPARRVAGTVRDIRVAERNGADDERAGGDRGRRRRDLADEVVVGLPVALRKRLTLARAVEVDGIEPHVDLRRAGQPEQRKRVAAPDQLLRERHHQVLLGVARDGEHARAELIAGGLFQKRRILLAMQEVLVDTARLGLLDHLGLLELAVQLHREARHRRARRQRDRERALACAVLGVVEIEVELGVGERAFGDGARVDARQGEAATVGRREGERRRDLARRSVGAERAHPHRRDARGSGRRAGRDECDGGGGIAVRPR